MKILSIETSCDETAISVISAEGDFPDATYEILGNAVNSQIELHREYGGVFPTLAKREHAKAVVPLLKIALEEAEMLEEGSCDLSSDTEDELRTLLYREPDMIEDLLTFFKNYDQPEFDLIAVTSGPGLEPALWVGVNFAKALASVWNVPVVPTNHMEGHILASIYDVDRDDQLAEIQFPTLALLISGGHTELDLMKDWGHYQKIGETRDDAVGEAFDKVARMMGLPYPGGPEISKLAKIGRKQNLPPYADLPKPMIGSGDLDFSFSGLKTAVRYAIADPKTSNDARAGQELTETDKQALARDFEDVVATVLLKKVHTALDEHGAQTFVVGGGVSANSYLRETFNKELLESHPNVAVYFPTPGMSTDNSIMIALAGHAKCESKLGAKGAQHIRADGNRSLSTD